MLPNSYGAALLIMVVGLLTGVPLWWIAMRSHGRIREGNRLILAALEANTKLIVELTHTIHLDQPLRIHREGRQALLQFLNDSGFFTRREQRDRLLEDLPGALASNIERVDVPAEDLYNLVVCITKWGRRGDFIMFLDNARYIFGSLPIGDQFAALRREQGWL